MTSDTIYLSVVVCGNVLVLGFALLVLNLKPVKESKQLGEIRVLLGLVCLAVLLFSVSSYFFAWKPASDALRSTTVDPTTPEK